MASSVEIGSTEIHTHLAPEVIGEPTPGLTEAEVADGPIPEPDKLERIAYKQDEEEAVKATKGRKDGKETNSRRDSLDRVNMALVVSVAVAAVVGAIVTIAKKLRER